MIQVQLKLKSQCNIDSPTESKHNNKLHIFYPRDSIFLCFRASICFVALTNYDEIARINTIKAKVAHNDIRRLKVAVLTQNKDLEK